MIKKATRSPARTTDHHVCEEIVSAVAASTSTGPLELPPIYEAIDIDALEKLFSGREGDRSRPPSRVEFTYYGCRVQVESTGNVHVSPEHTPGHHETEAPQRIERDETGLCESIVTAVGTRTETELHDMETLYSVIDSGALAKLIDGAHQRARNPESLEVQFHYQGCRVTVEGDGRVKVDTHRAS